MQNDASQPHDDSNTLVETRLTDLNLNLNKCIRLDMPDRFSNLGICSDGKIPK